ncbi:DUF309 domain-containing protein [Natronomonas sp. EA1]|uniref:DUF309 domain-containing protein n=1 Tax=Natronomonas sp. EA1 TaxID=3421655 RepID=UPI003EC1049C
MDHLRAGAAVFNAGYHHAAHDAWEERWLDCEGEERTLLQGLIQYAAAVHHAGGGNSEGARNLAESAAEYLTEARARADDAGVNADEIREYLARLETNPSLREEGEGEGEGEEGEPPLVEVAGEVPRLDDLRFPAAGIAARALAHGHPHEETVTLAVEYAEADLADDTVSSPFVTLLLDYIGGAHGVVLQRLEQHVQRRTSKEEDVKGLFDT